MKIDTALRTFTEKYDAEAMQYVDRLSKDFGLVQKRRSMKGVAIQEAFSRFTEYLDGYGKYMCSNIDNPKASPRSTIQETTEHLITQDLFKSADLLYEHVGTFVTSYLEGVQKLLSTIDSVKTTMAEAGVDADAIGDVNDYADKFMERADAEFYPVMERIITASGYTSSKALAPGAPKKEVPVFL